MLQIYFLLLYHQTLFLTKRNDHKTIIYTHNSYGTYIQQCLDHTGTGLPRCAHTKHHFSVLSGFASERQQHCAVLRGSVDTSHMYIVAVLRDRLYCLNGNKRICCYDSSEIHSDTHIRYLLLHQLES